MPGAAPPPAVPIEYLQIFPNILRGALRLLFCTVLVVNRVPGPCPGGKRPGGKRVTSAVMSPRRMCPSGASQLISHYLPKPPAAPWPRGPRSVPPPPAASLSLWSSPGAQFRCHRHSQPTICALEAAVYTPGRLLPCLARLPSRLCPRTGRLHWLACSSEEPASAVSIQKGHPSPRCS